MNTELAHLAQESIDVDALLARGRKLTSGEVAYLRTVFGSGVPYTKVRVVRGGLLTKFGYVVTINNAINYPEDRYEDDFSKGLFWISNMALLSHEITHVWQWANRINGYTWFKALLEHIFYGKNVYEYEPLDVNKSLTDYRFEQQGQIVQNFFFYRATGADEAASHQTVVRRALPNADPWPPPTFSRGQSPFSTDLARGRVHSEDTSQSRVFGPVQGKKALRGNKFVHVDWDITYDAVGRDMIITYEVKCRNGFRIIKSCAGLIQSGNLMPPELRDWVSSSHLFDGSQRILTCRGVLTDSKWTREHVGKEFEAQVGGLIQSPTGEYLEFGVTPRKFVYPG